MLVEEVELVGFAESGLGHTAAVASPSPGSGPVPGYTVAVVNRHGKGFAAVCRPELAVASVAADIAAEPDIVVVVDYMLPPIAVAGILVLREGEALDLPACSESMEEVVGNEPLAVERIGLPLVV